MTRYIKHNAKLHERQLANGVSHFLIWCPGCQEPHAYATSGSCSWSFNGNLERPTFTPSLLHHGNPRCHLNLTDGMIQFHGDCEHALKNTVQPMADFPVPVPRLHLTAEEQDLEYGPQE